MKKQLFVTVIMLAMLMLLFNACGLPEASSGDENSGMSEASSGDENSGMSESSSASLETQAVVLNPITEVEFMNNGLELTLENGKKLTVESGIHVEDGYNSVSYTHDFDAESGVLTLTLLDGMKSNVALEFLGCELPDAAMAILLRSNGDIIEWTYEDDIAWRELCRADDESAKPLALIVAKTGFGAADAQTGEGVTFVISGNNLRFRARNWQNEGYDLCNDAILHGPVNASNENFLLRGIREIRSTLPPSAVCGGTLFKNASDEIPSICINGTYIAALHGYYLISSVPNGDFTEADIGRVFTRESDGQRYVLVKVLDKVWFCPFDDAAMESGDFTPYGWPAKGKLKKDDLLTYEADGSKKNFTVSADATQEQFRSAANHIVQRAFLDGTIEVDLTKDGVYNAEFVDFCESYDILYLPSVLKCLMNNVGENTNETSHNESIDDRYLSYVYTFRFLKNGSFTVYQRVDFHTDLKNVHYYGVMSESFGGEEQYVYAPGANNCGTVTNDKKGDYFYVEGDASVRSFYHFPDENCSKGMNVGYYPYFGVATDTERSAHLKAYGSSGAGEWSHILKMYPHLYKANTVKSGDSLSFIGYHCPTVRFDDDFFAVNWYFVGDEIYLSLHTDKETPIEERTLSLPDSEYLVGLAIEPDGESKGITVHSTEVGEDGIRVSSTGAGYITLRLTAKK